MNNDFTCSLLVDTSGLGLKKQEEIISDRVKSMNSGESICFITDNRDFSATISFCVRISMPDYLDSPNTAICICLFWVSTDYK